jgi:hypothetical protein
LTPRGVERGGSYLRVADPGWDNPLSGEYSRLHGGRWNAPRAFPVVYLCRDEQVARANVLRKHEGLPYGPEDLDPREAPVLVSTVVPRKAYVDIVSDDGCTAAGLPASYPHDVLGQPIGHDLCRPIGQAAWREGRPGIACRSAAPGAHPGGEELAFFVRGDALPVAEIRSFSDWY